MDTKSNLDIFILDAGSHTIRGGRAEDFPENQKTPFVALPSAAHAEGEDGGAQPIQVFNDNGEMCQWEAYESVVGHIIYDLLGWPQGDEGYILATENSLCTARSEREHVAQIMFETFNVRGLYILDSCVASLYAAGKVQGVAVDIGHLGTNIAQVSEGGLVVGSCERYPIGGKYLESVLKAQLLKRDINLSDRALEELKTRCSAIADSAADYDELVRTASSQKASEYTLPDDQKVSITTEGHTLGEALQRPSLGGAACFQCKNAEQSLALSEAAFSCVMMNSEPLTRQGLLDSIVLTGGVASLPGLAQRCMRDISMMLQPNASAAVVKIPEYMPSRTTKYAAYVGAAVVAKSLNASHTMTKEDYEERGPAFLHKKC